MYSNSSILVSISFIGFDKDFFSMAQIPTMTCLPKLAPLAECDPLPLLLSRPAAGPVRVALLPKASAKLLLEHPGVEVAVVGRCTPLDEVKPPWWDSDPVKLVIVESSTLSSSALRLWNCKTKSSSRIFWKLFLTIFYFSLKIGQKYACPRSKTFI